MHFYFLEIQDEQGRFSGLKVYNNGRVGQDVTNTASYLEIRKQWERQLGEDVGLGKRVVEEVA